MASRRRAESGPGQFCVAPAEYVILRKLPWNQRGGFQKHLRDIRGMLAVTGPSLDLAVLERWLGTLGLEAERQAVNSALLA